MKAIIFLLGALRLARANKRWIGAVDSDCGGLVMGLSESSFIEAEGACYVVFTASDEEAKKARALFSVMDRDDEVRAQAEPISWGLDRIDQAELPLDRRAFSTTHTGRGVPVYVLDTGISRAHEQFRGRAVRTRDFVQEPEGDGNGHGTHCAGTAAGQTAGVAVGADIVAVKVLGAGGSGAISGVVKALEWVRKDSGGRGVVSMSLGAIANKVLDRATTAASDSGLIVVVAAGNQQGDACKYSPARTGGKALARLGVITVGSTTAEDAVSTFSNRGQCVDIYAPGSNINSAWKGTPRSYRVLSGTSMATPHVAGAAAVLLEKHGGDKKKAVRELFARAVTFADSFQLLQVPPGSKCSRVSKRRRCRALRECVWLRHPYEGGAACYDRASLTPFPTRSPTKCVCP